MPLYEVDKSVVVLDIGSAFTKFGFSGEFAPRAIFRTQVHCKRSKKLRKVHDFNDSEDLYDLLVDFIHVVYFKYALLSPKDKPVVIVESLLCPTLFRETLAKVLFVHYEVSAVFFLPSHLVSIAPLAIDSALVLDVGYSEAVAIPVCYGLPILHAWQALPIGSKAVHNSLKTLLNNDNIGIQNLSEDVIEDIKVRCCLVTTHLRAENLSQPNPTIIPAPPVSYPVNGTDILTVSGKVRERAFEIWFEEDADHLCLSTMILDAILKVDINLRNILAENIVLIGGSSMAPGFKARLKQELLKQLNQSESYRILKIKSFKFHSLPCKENYAAWLGGAIYGATDWLNTKALSRENYLKEDQLPHWDNLKYNSRQV